MTLFTKIINGEIPCYKIYEDDLVFAFLDIKPIDLGHTLIVPKVEVDKIYDLNQDHYQAVFKAAQNIAKAIENATDCLRVCSWSEGFQVPHAHFHLCPFYEIADFGQKKPASRSEAEMRDIQAKIVANLSS